MLSATKQQKRKDYIVRYGYVYSDGHGNSYRPGDIVSLTNQEYDLCKHRVKPFVSQDQAKIEATERPNPPLYPKTPLPETVEEEKEEIIVEGRELVGAINSGDYIVK